MTDRQDVSAARGIIAGLILVAPIWGIVAGMLGHTALALALIAPPALFGALTAALWWSSGGHRS